MQQVNVNLRNLEGYKKVLNFTGNSKRSSAFNSVELDMSAILHTENIFDQIRGYAFNLNVKYPSLVISLEVIIRYLYIITAFYEVHKLHLNQLEFIRLSNYGSMAYFVNEFSNCPVKVHFLKHSPSLVLNSRLHDYIWDDKAEISAHRQLRDRVIKPFSVVFASKSHGHILS